MPPGFANKLALVTGGGSGIGRAVCQLLSHEGATVIVASNILEAAQDTTTKCTQTSSQLDKHMAVELDVRNSNSVQDVLSTVLKTYDRPPSIVVNAAGIALRKSLLKITESEYDDVIDTNMKGTFLILQKFGKAMVEAETADGSIVNVSSYLGRNGFEGFSHYTASTAGILGITIGAAKELGRNNIRVNAVLPGLVQTPMLSVMPKAVIDNYIKINPLNRIAEPKDVAELIVF